jgi:predicted ATPase/class 3 adenylate cyclase
MPHIRKRFMPDLPSGTVTFLFTDIEGSTALWERDHAAMATAVARHLTLLRDAVAAHTGVVFKVVGDAVQAAFPTAPDAVAAALDAQRALVQQAWPAPVGALPVRMALHTAAATPQDGDYLAPGLNRLARLLAAAHGGQVLLSLATQDLARDALPPGAGLRDLGEHPLRDLYRPERVFQLLHPDLPGDFPPIRTLATRPNNLPLQPTALVGRENDVARIVDLLSRDDVRLLTITGPGGVGKTRLALQAAADLLEAFPDGVWFVDLSALDDPALVSSAIATVLGVREEGSGLSAPLARVLGGKRLLLVLDNFERVVDAASVVADLLARASGVKVLATSRTPLHAYGEREFPLPPFPMPDLAHLPSVETLSQYEAVRLFIERAQAVKPDFTVTTANAPAVAEICHRLDGLPLAIELAAAYVKVLPPQALLKRLERRLPLLTGGARTLPARQQTMRDAIAWSHDLLDQEEQVLFRRLAVFAGGCTIEAAEAVASPDGTLDVFSGMAALVDKSLLRQEEGAEGEPRFRMLETVREFGLERLEASGEGTACRGHHAGFFLALAERTRPRIFETGDPAWLDVIEREHDNLRVALGWSWETGKHDTLLRLAGSLGSFWYYRGHLTEGRRWLDRALKTPPDDAAPRPRAWALTASGLLATVAGDTERAAEQLTASFEWWERSGDAAGLAVARSLLGGVYVSQGRYDAAEALFTTNESYFRDNEAYLREAGHENWLVHARFHLGVIAWAQGDEARARSLLRDIVDHVERSRVPADAIDPLRYLGLIACAAGDLDEAAGWFGEMVTRLRQRGSRAAIAVGLADVATLAAARGAWQPAARLFTKAEALLKAEAAAFSLPARDHYERAHARARETLGEEDYQAAAAAGRALTVEQALVEAETLLEREHDGSAAATSAP